MKKKNPFERTKQYFYEDGEDIHWWIDEEDTKEFLEAYQEHPLKCTSERELNGKEWNEFVLKCPYGDYEGTFIDEDCPKCGHLLVVPNNVAVSTKERFCPECSWESEEYKEAEVIKRKEWETQKNKKPEIKLRVIGEDIFTFVKRVGLGLDKHNGFSEKDKNYWVDCIVCKKSIPASDYFIGQDTGMAIVLFNHDHCTNGGPCIATPFKKETKKEWRELLGGSHE